MSSSYTLLSIGGLVLMMVAAMNANRIIATSDAQPIESEQSSQAIALAEAMLGEMRAKKFDENERDTLILRPTDFTVILGPEAGSERDSCLVPDTTDYLSSFWYDDIDDYHGYVRQVRASDETVYEVSVEVSYVSEDVLAPTSTRTYFKRVVITVANPANESIVTLSSIRTY